MSKKVFNHPYPPFVHLLCEPEHDASRTYAGEIKDVPFLICKDTVDLRNICSIYRV